MKIPFFTLISLSAILLSITGISYGQNVSPEPAKAGNTQYQSIPENEEVMTGIKVVPIPIMYMNTDFGFQYGILAQLYNYGDGARYPDHYECYSLQAARYVSGSGELKLSMESFRIIPGVRVLGEINYSTYPATSFYGENGAYSVYNPSWIDPTSPDYKSRMFYSASKKIFNVSGLVEGSFKNKNFKWNGSLDFGYYGIGSVDINKINERKEATEKLPTLDIQPGLFEIYKERLGLIQGEETEGWTNSISLSASLDTRNYRQNPTKGVWTEIGLTAAPGLMGNKSEFTKFHITHRQYLDLAPERLTLAYRLHYEQKLSGDIPFYYQYHHGAGGTSSVRGVLYSKINGDGFAYGNTELRWKAIMFKVKNVTRYIGFNAFYDFGLVTDKTELPQDLKSTFNAAMEGYDYSDFFSNGDNGVYQSAGLGLVLGFSHSITIVMNVGKSFDPKNGSIGMAFGLSNSF